MQFHFNVSKFGDSTGAAGGSPTTNLQQAYNNSADPEIITNSILDGVTFRRGSASDADAVFQIQNGVGVNKISFDGSGRTTTTNLSITGITSGTGLTNFVVVDANGNTFYQTGGVNGSSGDILPIGGNIFTSSNSSLSSSSQSDFISFIKSTASFLASYMLLYSFPFSSSPKA